MAADSIANVMPVAKIPEAPARKLPAKASSDDAKKGASFAEELGREPRQAAEKKAPEARAAERKALQPLRKAVASQKQALEATPSLALLSGKLDKLSPAAIPDLVTSNDFVAGALGEVDVQAFLDKPASVADLLDALGVPPAVAEVAERLGLDLAAIVSPNELLRALGVDPQRVFAELKVLKDNLATDGVAGYMKRAQALQKGAAATDPGKGQEIAGATLAGAGAVAGAGAGAGAGAAVATAERATAELKGRRPVGELAAEGLGTPSLGKTPKEPRGPEVAPAAVAVAPWQLAAMGGGLAQKAAAPATPDASGLTPAMPRAPDVAALAAPVTPDVTLPTVEAPRMSAATFDSFHAMGDKLAVDPDVVRLDGQAMPSEPVVMTDEAQKLTPDAAKLPATLQQAMSVAPPVKAPAKLTAPVVDPLRMAAPEVTVAMPEAVVEIEPKAQDALSPRQWQSFAATAAAADTAQTPAQGARVVDADDLARVLRFEEPLRDQSQGRGERDGERRGEGEHRMSEGASRFFEAIGPQAAPTAAVAGAGSSFKAQLAPEQVMTAEERTQLMQQVVDRASFLAKDGGGTVRLDIGTAALGSLELAVNLENDRIDVRIVTASDRARDVIASEMSRLRDALSTQNMQLGSVEVGVGRREESAASFAQQFANRDDGRSRAETYAGDVSAMASTLRGAADVASRAAAPLGRAAAQIPAALDGRINVRA